MACRGGTRARPCRTIRWREQRRRTLAMLDRLASTSPIDVPIGSCDRSNAPRSPSPARSSSSPARIRLLVLDEPTAALPPAEVDSLFEILTEIRGVGRRRALRLAPARGDPPARRPRHRAARRAVAGDRATRRRVAAGPDRPDHRQGPETDIIAADGSRRHGGAARRHRSRPRALEDRGSHATAAPRRCPSTSPRERSSVSPVSPAPAAKWSRRRSSARCRCVRRLVDVDAGRAVRTHVATDGAGRRASRSCSPTARRSRRSPSSPRARTSRCRRSVGSRRAASCARRREAIEAAPAPGAARRSPAAARASLRVLQRRQPAEADLRQVAGHHARVCMILDDPTSGVDVGARARLYELIRQQAEHGMGVILVSSDLEDLVSVAHAGARGRRRSDQRHPGRRRGQRSRDHWVVEPQRVAYVLDPGSCRADRMTFEARSRTGVTGSR